MIRSVSGLAALTLLSIALPAVAEDAAIIRHPIPDSDFPVAQAVEIPGSATRVLLSGTVPEQTDSSPDPNSAAAYGDTEVQTVSVLRQIEAKLQALDLSIGDVVKMQVFLVAPSEDAFMDFAGFMKGYTQFFGTQAQKNLPTRSVFRSRVSPTQNGLSRSRLRRCGHDKLWPSADVSGKATSLSAPILFAA